MATRILWNILIMESLLKDKLRATDPMARELFYVDNMTWCIVPQFTEDVTDIVLVFLVSKDEIKALKD